MTPTALRVREVVAEHLGLDVAEILLESRFIEDLGADSLDSYDLAIRIEEACGVYIDDVDVPKLTMVGELIAHVEAARAQKAGAA